MSVNKEKHEELAGKWSPIVAECDARDIGESIDVWCEKKGISKWKLYYWKKALKNSASAEHPCKTETAGQCLDITDLCLHRHRLAYAYAALTVRLEQKYFNNTNLPSLRRGRGETH